MSSEQARLIYKIKAFFQTTDGQTVKKIKQLIKKAMNLEQLMEDLKGFGQDLSNPRSKQFVKDVYFNFSSGMIETNEQHASIVTSDEDSHQYNDDSNQDEGLEDEEWEDLPERQLRRLEPTAQKKQLVDVPWTKEYLKFTRGTKSKVKNAKASKKTLLTKKKEEKLRKTKTRDSNMNCKDYIEKTFRKTPIAVISCANSQITAKIPLWLMENYHQIVCTQSRWHTAFSYANWASKQTDLCFDKDIVCLPKQNFQFDSTNRLIYATESVAKQIIMAEMLDSDSLLILNGSHQRTKQIDIILCLIKQYFSDNQKRMPKFIVTSNSQIQAKKIARYLRIPHSDMISVPTESIENLPVLIHYCTDTKKQQQRLRQTFVSLILKIYNETSEGNIACFVSDEKDGDKVIRALNNQLNIRKLKLTNFLAKKVCSVHFKKEQRQSHKPWFGRQFQVPKQWRVCLIATSVSEILHDFHPKYVIDCGFVSHVSTESFSSYPSLLTYWICKRQANQRTSLVAKTPGGECYRLYSHWRFTQMTEEVVPELHYAQKSSLSLMVKENGIEGIHLIDSPSSNVICKSLNQLCLLGVLSRDGLVSLFTDLSVVDLRLSVAMAYSVYFSCVDDTAIICSLISVKDSIFDSSFFPSSIKKFSRPKGDFLCLLKLFKDWQESSRSEQWCKKQGVRMKTLLHVLELKEKFIQMLRKANMIEEKVAQDNIMAHEDHIRKCFLHGFQQNLALHRRKQAYRTKDGKNLAIHSCSTYSQSNNRPKYVIFEEIRERNKMCLVAEMEPEWICDYEPSPESYEK